MFRPSFRPVSAIVFPRFIRILSMLISAEEHDDFPMGDVSQRLLREADHDSGRLDLMFRLLTSRQPNDAERRACETLLGAMRERYAGAEQDAQALIALGDAPRDPKLKPAEVAAWTQVAVTVLASDLTILLY